MLDEIYTELIAEHSRSRENRQPLSNATIRERGHNPSCGDDITIELAVSDGVIVDASFNGAGCAISQASADMMIELMRGKPLAEAKRLAELFIAMIQGTVTSDDALADLDEAAALKNISTMPARVKCATLAWHALDNAVNKL